MDKNNNKYAASGVSLEAGYESVKKIKKHLTATNILGVMSQIGQFGGMFDLSAYNFKEPVLISGCDGVGTKIKLCELWNDFSNIGEDLVAMSVNDIIVQGAKPLFFLDYIACQKNNPDQIEQIVKSISNGCILSKCALIGGETAEMPDVYSEGGYDLAGFAVGCAEKKDIITGENVKPKDVIIGLPSNGIHSNGYSLVRQVFLKDNDINTHDIHPDLGCSLQEELLKPTKIYVKDVLDVLEQCEVNSMAHITGGGYFENIARATNGYGAKIYTDKINTLPIFDLIAKTGNISKEEMFNYFNMGIGYIFIANETEAKKILNILPHSMIIGEITEDKEVILCES